MNRSIREILLWAFIILPILYLVSIWNMLPEQVPTHFDMDGNPNDWSSKETLMGIIIGLNVGIYLMFIIIPKIDPKKKFEEMGSKYDTLRILIGIFISLLSCFVLNLSKQGNAHNPQLLFALIGGLFAVLGNYFQALRPNYFIGIRTPWTIEHPEVWKSTHRIGGYVWMLGGVAIAILSFVLNANHTFDILFVMIMLVMVFIPTIYSYKEFKRISNSEINS